jgi:hypothetical protein
MRSIRASGDVLGRDRGAQAVANQVETMGEKIESSHLLHEQAAEC